MAERKIGLFGGTFNPVHLGHLRGAEEIRESFGLEEVVFIPSAIPPHKTTEEIIEPHHRLEMVKRAIRKNPRFRASDVELKRSGKSYSIDTIRYFREKLNGPLYFILGRDAFVEIETWKDFQNLFSLSHFIVMTRPNLSQSSPLPRALAPAFRYDQKSFGWMHVSGNTIFFKEINFLDISSTKVRELIQKGKSIKYLVPSEVEAYIVKHGLYRGGEERGNRS
ncbi:MAG: nicotinate-nucleotide adenylyltransferase [Thermodesulfobacteriota bacterium]